MPDIGGSGNQKKEVNVKKANSQKNTTKMNLPIFGSLVSAIMASICCIGPIVLAVLGVGGAGLFSKFVNLRPYLIGITVVLLGLAFYLTYRKRKVKCEDGTCEIRRALKWNKIALRMATVLIVFFLAFPYLAGRLNTNSANNHMNGEISEVIITVGGMICSGCEFNVENAIKKYNGILNAKADYKKGEAHVKFEKGKVSVNDMMKAINKAGYKAIER